MKFFRKKIKHSSKKNEAKAPLRNVMDGSILTNDGFLDQVPYILFLTLIAVIYIGNRYHAEKILRETINISHELKELRAEAITSTSNLMFKSKQSEVARLVEQKGLGLKEAVEPPRKLTIKDE